MSHLNVRQIPQVPSQFCLNSSPSLTPPSSLPHPSLIFYKKSFLLIPDWFCPIRRADLLAAVGQVGNSEFSLPDEWCVTLPSRDQAVDESSVTLPSRDQAVNELSRVKDHSSASYAVVTFTKNAFLKKRVKMVP